MKSKCVHITLILLLCFTFASAAGAGDGILDQVKAAQESGVPLVDEVDSTGGRLVDSIRTIAAVAAVLFLIWAGFTFFTAGGDSQALSAAKSRLLYFFVALFIVGGAEKIVATVASWVGWQIK